MRVFFRAQPIGGGKSTQDIENINFELRSESSLQEPPGNIFLGIGTLFQSELNNGLHSAVKGLVLFETLQGLQDIVALEVLQSLVIVHNKLYITHVGYQIS